MIRFALHPGPIISVNDGDEHWISAVQLADLYGVSLHECAVIDFRRPNASRGLDSSRLLHLYPQQMAYPRVTPAERRQFPIDPGLPEPSCRDSR